MKKIGLCIIAKNEAHVIERCLQSALPLIDYALIVDTGSTDGTVAITRAFLHSKDLPGDVISEPWQDFAYNRSFALEQLRKQGDIDYCLVIDADDFLVFDAGFDPASFKASLDADTYDVAIQHGKTTYSRPQLFNNRKPYRFKGVLHEFLECPSEHSRKTADGFHIHYSGEGARSRNPEKYRHDARILEEALQKETDPHLKCRYTFYLAQSYRDCGETAKALEWYLARAALGQWQEEVFVSLLNAGRLRERLEHQDADIIDAYMKAVEATSNRAEGHYEVARFCRQRKRYRQAYLLSKAGLDIPLPKGGLFVELVAYDYGLLDEFAVSAYWTGNFAESLNACSILLKENKFPPSERERIMGNASVALEKLKAAPGSRPS